MRLRSIAIPLFLLFLFACQSPEDTIRQHYEAAEAQRLAGNLLAAESEYKAILQEGYQRLGEVFLAEEDYRRALTALEPAAEYRPTSPVLINLAIAYFGTAQYQKALEAARKALVVDPRSAGGHQMLGKTYFMLGDLGKSIAALETAARLAPNDMDVAYTLGIAYLRNRQSAEARQLYDSMIRQFGERPQLHVVVGRAYRQSGMLAEAAAEFKKAIALDGGFPRAHYYLGITYLLDEGQSKIAEAVEEFKLELAANPGEFFANYYAGVVYIYQRKWEPAIPFLQKASTLEPNNPDPYFQLGQAYQELNKHEQAVDVLRKAIALNPNLAHNKGQVTVAHHRLAQSLLKLGQTDAGQKELQLASDMKAEAFKLEQQVQTGAAGMGTSKLPEPETNSPAPGFRQGLISESLGPDEKTMRELQSSANYYQKVIATAHNNIGLLRAEQKDFRGAAAQFAIALQWNPEQEGLDYNLGLAYYKSESFEQAIPPLEKELRIHPANHPAMALLGMSWFMKEDYARAAELLGSVVDSKATDENVYYVLASSLIKQGKIEDAARVLEQMKAITADSPLLHLALAEKHFTLKDVRGALAELTQALALKGTAPRVHYYAGVLYLRLARPDEGIREFERELAVNPDDVLTKYRLGDLLLGRGKIDRAVQLMRETIQGRPQYAEARYDLGRALLQKGDVTGAIDCLEVAVKLDPKKPDFHYQLGEAYITAGRKADGKSQIEISKDLRAGLAIR